MIREQRIDEAVRRVRDSRFKKRSWSKAPQYGRNWAQHYVYCGLGKVEATDIFCRDVRAEFWRIEA